MKYRLGISKGKNGNYRWQIVNKVTGKAAALSLVNEHYLTKGEAAAAGHKFIDGMQRPHKCHKYLAAAAIAGVLVGIAICRLGGL